MTELEKLILAHRYLYYVKSHPVIPDYQYDQLEKEAIASLEGRDSPILTVGSDLEDSYSNEIKDLAWKIVKSAPPK
jgi:NAD-dependent DNA ligase